MHVQAAHDKFQGRSTALQGEIQKLDQTIQVANASAQREGEVFAKVRQWLCCCKVLLCCLPAGPPQWLKANIGCADCGHAEHQEAAPA